MNFKIWTISVRTNRLRAKGKLHDDIPYHVLPIVEISTYRCLCSPVKWAQNSKPKTPQNRQNSPIERMCVAEVNPSGGFKPILLSWYHRLCCCPLEWRFLGELWMGNELKIRYRDADCLKLQRRSGGQWFLQSKPKLFANENWITAASFLIVFQSSWGAAKAGHPKEWRRVCKTCRVQKQNRKKKQRFLAKGWKLSLS